MPTLSFTTLLSLSALAGYVTQFGSAYELNSRQSSSGLFINPPGFLPLPSVPQARSAASKDGLNLTNIQGDTLTGMRMRKELFFFFGINPSSVATFKSKLASDIYPLVTNTLQLLDESTRPETALNIAFSQSGLRSLGITGQNPLNDTFFAAGQAADVPNLGDPGTANWVPGFINTNALHGVFLIASSTIDNINAELSNIQLILGNSIVEIHRLQGEARPGAEEGHEHFGFLDGISQPAVSGFKTAIPPQAQIDAGTILLGRTGDTRERPDWTTDGSFLVFRQLKQLVPEFNKFLTDNPVRVSPLTPEQGSALMGARMMGRWKSGAPVDLAPLFDNKTLADDPMQNNNFRFGRTNPGDQSRCPFAAHIRKTNPRDDISPQILNHHIIRAGLPYGPEVTSGEANSNTTSIERGLAFVAYQSNIQDGFQFLQKVWANNVDFLQNQGDPLQPGYDPIIGANQGAPRNVTGLDLANQRRTITLPFDFVVSRGGEYFFSPSLSAIRGMLSV